MYIQNPVRLRNRITFKTPLYSEPEAYSEYCQTSKIKQFCKNSFLVHFLSWGQKIVIKKSPLRKVLIFSHTKAFLIFREMKLSYILGDGHPPKFVLLYLVRLRAWRVYVLSMLACLRAWCACVRGCLLR